MDHRRKKKIKTSAIVKTVVIVLLLAAILTGVILYLRNRVKTEYGSRSNASIESATVESGSISTTVYGTGRLQDDDTETLEIPDGVELDEVRVAVGDSVAEGDVLASVKTASVISAMSKTQAEIDKLDSQLKDAAEEEIDDAITASVAGRVKKIYAAEGDDVSSVMIEHNAMALLSLDGSMALELQADTLSVSDAVTVTASDGTAYAGEVEKKTGDTVTILIPDDGPVYEDSVTVTDEDGQTLGTAKLFIHDPLSVVGFAGKVDSVSVSENKKVSAGATLFKLTDTAYTANYEQLLSERETLEETLLSLVEIYRSGAVIADCTGTVKGIPGETTGDSTEESTGFTICPDETMTISVSIDETDILSLSVGQEVDVSVTSMDDETFSGTITAIDKTGTSSNGVTQYTATVQLAKTEGMLAGMNASASITIESVDNALIIPLDALRQTSSTAYVYTSYDESTGELGGMVEVQTGISNSSYVEIVSGLSEGDTVYYQKKQSSGFGGFNMPGGFGSGGSGFPGGGSFPGGSGGSGFPGGGFSGGGDRPSGGSSDRPSGFPGGGPGGRS